MTLNVAARTDRYDGDGTTDTFAINFQFYAVAVYVDGELQTAGVDYTTTGGNGNTGAVVFADPPADGTLVVIVGNTPASQSVAISNNDDLPAEVIEPALDKAVMVAAEAVERIGRSIRGPIHDNDFDELDFRNNPNAVIATDEDGIPYLAVAATLPGVPGLLEDLDEAVAAAEAAQAAAESALATAQDVLEGLESFDDLPIASNVPFLPASGISATDTQAAVEEVALDVTAHLADSTAAHAASAIANTPAGNIAATDVQAALNELDTEKAATSHTHDDRYHTETEADARFSRLLASGTVTNAATLDIDFTSFASYSILELVLDGIAPATDDVELYCRLSTNGGSSFLSTTYSYHHLYGSTANASALFAGSVGAATEIPIMRHATANVAPGNDTGEEGSAIIRIVGAANAASRPAIHFTAHWKCAGANVAGSNGSGNHGTAAAFNAIRIYFESGNIAKCAWKLIGTP